MGVVWQECANLDTSTVYHWIHRKKDQEKKMVAVLEMNIKRPEPRNGSGYQRKSF
jgi:hypothetical protein